jgi:hypothetical protein
MWNIRRPRGRRRRQTDFISFYSPLSALSLIFPIGSYPFGSYDAARDWRSELDDWLLQLLRQQRGAFSFEIGAIGFEVETLPLRVSRRSRRVEFQ